MRVATAQNQPEAELLQSLLLEAGVPSLVRRSGGFDVPDFLAIGPRDILAPAGRRRPRRARCSAPARRSPAVRRPAPVWVRRSPSPSPPW